MKEWFTAGELSGYQKISKQTLIYYDRISLFCPAYVDEKTGYRYYSAAQLDDLDTILIMKKLGFSLKEIREHMRCHTAKESVEAFCGQLARIDQEIRDLEMIRNRLAHRCRHLEAALKNRDSREDIEVEHTDGMHVFYYDIQPPYSPKETSLAAKKCYTEAFRRKLPVYFECGVMVPLEHIMSGRYTEAVRCFLPVDQTDEAENLVWLPPGKTVTAYHVGDYASIGVTYEKVLAYCRKENLRIISGSYEFCINDYVTSNDENEFITEIMFYVEDASF